MHRRCYTLTIPVCPSILYRLNAVLKVDGLKAWLASCSVVEDTKDSASLDSIPLSGRRECWNVGDRSVRLSLFPVSFLSLRSYSNNVVRTILLHFTHRQLDIQTQLTQHVSSSSP
jgi:hypothetical protein